MRGELLHSTFSKWHFHWPNNTSIGICNIPCKLIRFAFFSKLMFPVIYPDPMRILFPYMSGLEVCKQIYYTTTYQIAPSGLWISKIFLGGMPPTLRLFHSATVACDLQVNTKPLQSCPDPGLRCSAARSLHVWFIKLEEISTGTQFNSRVKNTHGIKPQGEHAHAKMWLYLLVWIFDCGKCQF